MTARQSLQTGVVLLLSGATPVIAAEEYPFLQMPASLPGLATGWLQPEATNWAELGTRQTGAPDGGGTGTQLYDWSLGFRGNWPFQVGLSFHVFDDIPNSPLLGSGDKITFGSASVDGKYTLVCKRRPRPIDFHGSVTLMEQRVSF